MFFWAAWALTDFNHLGADVKIIFPNRNKNFLESYWLSASHILSIYWTVYRPRLCYLTVYVSCLVWLDSTRDSRALSSDTIGSLMDMEGNISHRFFTKKLNSSGFFSQILSKLWLVGNKASCRPIRSVIVIKQVGISLRFRLSLLIAYIIIDRIELCLKYFFFPHNDSFWAE